MQFYDSLAKTNNKTCFIIIYVFFFIYRSEVSLASKLKKLT